ncbi:MAG: chemotaxis protein CheA [Nitrospirae bacterium]|nr:chemotaxis protein CheA [Nitrospirota bacterium]
MSNPGNDYKEFLTEAEDIIQHLNKNLCILKTSCNSAKVHDPDVVNALFRGIHTLKGISDVTGFSRISSLSHRLEDLLDSLRFGRIKLNYDVVDALFEVADKFTALLNDINEQGNEYSDIAPAVERIGKLLKVRIQDDTGANINSRMPHELAAKLSDFEQYRVMASHKQGRRIYSLMAHMQIDCVDGEMSGLREYLTGCGEIIAVIPVSGFSSDDMMSFEILFSSDNNTISHPAIVSVTRIMEVKDTDVPEAAPHSAKSITKTVRVDIERLEDLLNTVGDILLLNSSMTHSINDIKIKYGYNVTFLDVNRCNKLLNRKIAALRDGLLDIRLVPVGVLFERLFRIVDLLSKELSRKVSLEVSGGDTRLDRSMIEELADPLMHLIRNAIDHGIEDEKVRRERGKDPDGIIRVSAVQKDSNVVIEIEDDGRGLNFDSIYNSALGMGLIMADERDERSLMQVLFKPGFTTKDTTDDVSGRGVGLDVVARNIEALSGMIDVETTYGKGTIFRITIPVSLLIVRALIVSASGKEFAIPLNSISENLRLRECDIKIIRDRECINLRGDYLPLVRLNDVMKYHGAAVADTLQKDRYVIIAGLAQKKMGIIVDKLYGQREILVKHPGKLLKDVPCIAGFAEIDTQKIVPVIDIAGLTDRTFCSRVPF